MPCQRPGQHGQPHILHAEPVSVKYAQMLLRNYNLEVAAGQAFITMPWSVGQKSSSSSRTLIRHCWRPTLAPSADGYTRMPPGRCVVRVRRKACDEKNDDGAPTSNPASFTIVSREGSVNRPALRLRRRPRPAPPCGLRRHRPASPSPRKIAAATRTASNRPCPRAALTYRR